MQRRDTRQTIKTKEKSENLTKFVPLHDLPFPAEPSL
jgi:hypothetical protein